MTRPLNQLRPVTVQRHFTKQSAGSVLYQCEGTMVLCTASAENKTPPWLAGSEKGWITAEYNMLPHSTSPRKSRDRKKVDGRTTEIQRLIGRSLRAVADLTALGERLITVDCDVLQADGGTRTASITGGFIALIDCIQSLRDDLPNPEVFPLTDSAAAVSVGIVNGEPTLDLNYEQDYAATVDMNLVMTGSGDFIELQGAGEEAVFNQQQLMDLIALGSGGVQDLIKIQKETLGELWPF